MTLGSIIIHVLFSGGITCIQKVTLFKLSPDLKIYVPELNNTEVKMHPVPKSPYKGDCITFLSHVAMLARYMLSACVCLSVRLSRRGTISKRLDESSSFLAWNLKLLPPIIYTVF